MDTEFQTVLLLKKRYARSMTVCVCVWMRDMMLGHGLLLLACWLAVWVGWVHIRFHSI